MIDFALLRRVSVSRSIPIIFFKVFTILIAEKVSLYLFSESDGATINPKSTPFVREPSANVNPANPATTPEVIGLLPVKKKYISKIKI